MRHVNSTKARAPNFEKSKSLKRAFVIPLSEALFSGKVLSVPVNGWCFGIGLKSSNQLPINFQMLEVFRIIKLIIFILLAFIGT